MSATKKLNQHSINNLNEFALAQLAQQLAQQLCRNCRNCRNNIIIFFSGPLGAGKTTFIRHFLQAMGITNAVKSPSYTLVESYQTEKIPHIYHWDFYRLADPEELEFLGFRDYLSQQALMLIEWPERVIHQASLKADLWVTLSLTENAKSISSRNLALQALSAKGQDLLLGALT